MGLCGEVKVVLLGRVLAPWPGSWLHLHSYIQIQFARLLAANYAQHASDSHRQAKRVFSTLATWAKFTAAYVQENMLVLVCCNGVYRGYFDL